MGKGACCQGRGAEFDPLNPHGAGNKLTPQSFPLNRGPPEHRGTAQGKTELVRMRLQAQPPGPQTKDGNGAEAQEFKIR